MLRTIILFVAFIVLSSWLVSCSSMNRPAVAESTQHYVIKNVNVVDVINKTIKKNHDVEVKNGRISAVSSSDLPSHAAQSETVKIIDGSGKYLIPGLWDNHSTLMYFSSEVDYPLYIANGVTSLRSNLSCPNENDTSIYACMKDKARWQQEVNNGELLGPKLHGWGTFPLNGKKVHPDSPPFHDLENEQEVIELVDYYARLPKSHQPTFLKIYNWIPPKSYLKLAEYAKAKGFKLSGHMPRTFHLEDVLKAGQEGIAHARLFVFDCSNIAEDLRAGKHRKTPLVELYPLLIKSFNEQACIQRYKNVAKSDVYLNPTLMTRRNDYYGAAGMYDKMLGTEYGHYLIQMEWREDIGVHGEQLSEQDIAAFRDFYHLTANTIMQAQKHGATILAGSDSWSEYNVPGFSLHEELQALSEAGIDNFSVLQAATINGARYFNIDDTIGSIDVGKAADLVLLDKNPVEDIKHTLTINTVFQGRKIYQKPKLDALKAEVKELANSHLFAAKTLLKLTQDGIGL